MSVGKPFCHRSPQRAIILASRADVVARLASNVCPPDE